VQKVAHPLGHARGLRGAHAGLAPCALLVPAHQPGGQLPLGYPAAALQLRGPRLLRRERGEELRARQARQRGQEARQAA
jgi:hypothetical protein